MAAGQAGSGLPVTVKRGGVKINSVNLFPVGEIIRKIRFGSHIPATAGKLLRLSGRIPAQKTGAAAA